MQRYIVDSLDSFEGEHQEIGVGHKFDRFDDGENAVQLGDVVVFDDPDAGQHTDQCELVQSEVNIGHVNAVYAVDYDTVDGYAVEVGATSPPGRVGLSDRYVGIVTENSVVGGLYDDRARRLASRLVDHDDYENSMRIVTHMGKNGVPDGLWQQYDEDSRSGPGCSVCTGDGTVIEGE